MYNLDETDVAILDVLRNNSKLSTREIAKKSSVPPATVYKRIRKMEKDGIIRRYSIVLDNEKLGRDTLAYVLIRTKPEADFTAMLNEIMKFDSVEDVAALAGEWDVFVKVRTKSIRTLDDFVLHKLRRFNEVLQTHTMIVFREWERDSTDGHTVL